jgi:hypothetical protein
VPPHISTARDNKFGIAWLALCASLMLHVTDEALTGFLSVYNPSVLAIRQTIPWFPMPVFGFGEWLGGLIAANIVLLALTPFAFRGARWLRPLAYVFAIVMLVNGLGHTLGTIFGRTFGQVHFPRPMPGFYSSPGLLAASIYMLVRLRATSGKKLGHDAHVAA